jgi:hypothetical protein
MLACDVLLEVRASRSLSGVQITALERMTFAQGGPGREQLDMLLLIGSYVARPDPRWSALLARAAAAVLPAEKQPVVEHRARAA